MGYTHKNTGKKLFNFLLATELPFMHPFSKSWSVLISAKSGQFEFVVRLYAILGDFWRFWAIFAKKRKIDYFFLQNPPKIAPNRRFSTIWRRIQIGQTLPISKLTNFLKIDAYMAILWPKENWTVFFLYFFGITQVKVENQLIFVKLLKNPQFLTKIHKVGLVWSITLICTD